MLKVIIILIVAIAFIIAINVLIYQWIIYKSKRKFIIPFLETNGWMLVDISHVGFFNTGDFDEEIGFSVVSEMGRTVNHTYAFVTASNSNGEIIKFTAKIATVFFLISGVEYKGIGIN